VGSQGIQEKDIIFRVIDRKGVNNVRKLYSVKR
jgi:hypothetical protein